MIVSCLCPTYNRVPAHQHLLEEAIESFLQQDYPDKELLILNDNPAQQLSCGADGVTVINVPRRFRSLGEKYNALVGMSSGKLFAPWEDDDISLPWRLSLSIRALAVTGADYYNPRRYWFWDSGRYHHRHPQGVGHACSTYNRRAFEAAGSYPCLSGSQDMVMDFRMSRTSRACGSPQDGHPELHISKWFYIHRWDTGADHLSGNGAHEAAYVAAAVAEHQPGAYQLTPRWLADYVSVTRAEI